MASFIMVAMDRHGDVYYTAGVQRQCIRSAILFISEFFDDGLASYQNSSISCLFYVCCQKIDYNIFHMFTHFMKILFYHVVIVYCIKDIHHSTVIFLL